jgi:hypothetical protein
MNKLPKDILIKLLTTIQDPETMSDEELEKQKERIIKEMEKRLKKREYEKEYLPMLMKNYKIYIK